MPETPDNPNNNAKPGLLVTPIKTQVTSPPAAAATLERQATADKPVNPFVADARRALDFGSVDHWTRDPQGRSERGVVKGIIAKKGRTDFLTANAPEDSRARVLAEKAKKAEGRNFTD